MEDEVQPIWRGTDYRDLAEVGGRSQEAEVCRKHGISDAIFYKGKAKYGGMAVSDVRRQKALEDQNTELKTLLAEAMLDNAMLRDVAARKW
jgi:putative transposase